MVKFDVFEVEQWMDTYETTPGVLNLAETCASSVSIDDLRELSNEELSLSLSLSGTKLTYGQILGSSTLRQRVAALIVGQEGHLPVENIIITQGAIAANFLTFYALIHPGDHVICVYPTYQQLYSVPESLGAEISLWRLKPENGSVPDVDDLEELAKPNTKMIVLNNPNNPTGAIIPGDVLRRIVAFARERQIIILSDEVYRPLFHNGRHPQTNPDVPPSVADLGYDNVIVTGSMSKAYALAGIRLGWLASPSRSIVDRLAKARDYTTISVSQLDDQVASYALSPAVVGPLLERNIELARRNAGILGVFVREHSSVCRWEAHEAGTTAFIEFCSGGRPVDDVAFCKDVLERTKVMLVPGSLCFGGGKDFAGFVRMGYVCETSVLEEGLAKLGVYLDENLKP